MGVNTTNGYFYKPTLGASGTSEMNLFHAKLDVADAEIKLNKDTVALKANIDSPTFTTKITVAMVEVDVISSPTANSIEVKPDGDTDDFFTFKSLQDRPTIKREGGKFIYFESTNVYDVGISFRADATYSGTLNYEKDNHMMTVIGKNSPFGFKANSDYVNYIKFQTASSIPEITVVASNGLKINAGGTNALLLNHAGGNVGIGETTPTAVLHLKAGTASASTAPLKFTSGTLLTTPEAGAMEFLTDTFYGTITSGAARKAFAFRTDKLSIFAATTSAELAGVISDETGSGGLVFRTSPNFLTKVGISSSVEVCAEQDAWITNQVPSAIYRTGDGGGAYPFQTAGNLVIQSRSNVARDIVFATGSTTPSIRMIVKSTGEIEVSSGQLKFPATQNASSDANTLDDYEEGSWTPAISFGGGTTGITYATQAGLYTKVGRKVTATAFITLSSKGTDTGIAIIGGLPFTCKNADGAYSAVTLYYSGIIHSGSFQGFVAKATTNIHLREITVGGLQQSTLDTDFADASQIMLSATYFV